MIVLLHGTAAYGAVERYVEAIARGLRRRHEEVVLIHPRELTVLAELAGGNLRTVALELAAAPRVTRQLARQLRRLRPRVAHVTEVWPPAMIAARLARVPRLLLTHHTPELPRRDNVFGHALLALAWRMRPEVVYTSESQRAGDGRDALVTRVVPLGIDVARFASGSPTLELEGRLIGNVARLTEQKGQRYLIEALPRVLEQHPDARLVLVGNGELRGELQARVRELGIADRIHFLGARNDVPDLLASFELCVFPSLFEGFCLAVIEAQAAGAPVVATPVGGIRETVRHGETGYLVPSRDPGALAEQLVWCLDHAGETRRVAAAAQRLAWQWTEERMIEETLALYAIR